MQRLLTNIYKQIVFQHPPLIQNSFEKLLRAQATSCMVTLYIIDPYEPRKEEKPHGENPPSKMDMKEKPESSEEEEVECAQLTQECV